MNNKKSATPLWEKIVGGLGLVLLCAGFIYLTWTALNNEKSPPDISFDIDAITAMEAGFLVTVNVSNSGSESAAALQVQGVLSKNGVESETYTMEIDYIPSRSTREIGFFFKKDPRTGLLEFNALGYQKP